MEEGQHEQPQEQPPVNENPEFVTQTFSSGIVITNLNHLTFPLFYFCFYIL
jgi:hypothetical protein